MKRDRLTFVAALLLFGVFVLALSVQSFADEKKDRQAGAKDVKFACAVHGPLAMTLALSPEKGAARKIEVIGGLDTKKWVVKIDGKDETPDNGGTLKVRSGDSITWSVSVATRSHGVVFADQDLAQSLLDFDMKASKPLKDQMDLAKNDPDWRKFGSKLWGTDGFKGVVVLASCKVK